MIKGLFFTILFLFPSLSPNVYINKKLPISFPTGSYQLRLGNFGWRFNATIDNNGYRGNMICPLTSDSSTTYALFNLSTPSDTESVDNYLIGVSGQRSTNTIVKSAANGSDRFRVNRVAYYNVNSTNINTSNVVGDYTTTRDITFTYSGIFTDFGLLLDDLPTEYDNNLSYYDYIDYSSNREGFYGYNVNYTFSFNVDVLNPINGSIESFIFNGVNHASFYDLPLYLWYPTPLTIGSTTYNFNSLFVLGCSVDLSGTSWSTGYNVPTSSTVRYASQQFTEPSKYTSLTFMNSEIYDNIEKSYISNFLNRVESNNFLSILEPFQLASRILNIELWPNFYLYYLVLMALAVLVLPLIFRLVFH